MTHRENLKAFRNLHGLSNTELAKHLCPEDSKSMLQKIIKWEKNELEMPHYISLALNSLESQFKMEKSANVTSGAAFKFVDLFAGIG
jgi:hypothetical protein